MVKPTSILSLLTEFNQRSQQFGSFLTHHHHAIFRRFIFSRLSPVVVQSLALWFRKPRSMDQLGSHLCVCSLGQCFWSGMSVTLRVCILPVWARHSSSFSSTTWSMPPTLVSATLVRVVSMVACGSAQVLEHYMTSFAGQLRGIVYGSTDIVLVINSYIVGSVYSCDAAQ